MTVFSNISKAVGWEERKVEIPSVNNAAILLKLVKERHCRISFRRVLEIHRFAPTASTGVDFEAMKIVYKAFEIGTNILQKYHT